MPSTQPPAKSPTQIPVLSCDGYDIKSCLLSGNPVIEEPALTECNQASLLQGCDGSARKWRVSLLTSGFDPFNQETFFVYNVTQPGGGIIDHITVSWTGNCCVRDASFFGSSLAYGLDPRTCKFGVKYDRAFSKIQSAGFYKIVVAGELFLLFPTQPLLLFIGGKAFAPISYLDLTTARSVKFNRSSSPSGIDVTQHKPKYEPWSEQRSVGRTFIEFVAVKTTKSNPYRKSFTIAITIRPAKR
jgi:hypothetical protein